MEEERWLVKGAAARVHELFGDGSYFEYLVRLFGYGYREATERLRVARALEELPVLTEALERQDVTWSAGREVTRVATPEHEAAWASAVAGKTVREIEKMVAGLPFGSPPGARPDPELSRHVPRFEVSAETMALMREAQAKVARDADHGLSHDDVLQLVAHAVLGRTDEARAPDQVQLSVCERCGTASPGAAGGEAIEVQDTVVEKAMCDASVVPNTSRERIGTHVGPRPGRASHTIPPATRRQIFARHQHRCAVTGCRHGQHLAIRNTKRRSEGGTHDPKHMILLCSAHHTAEHEGRLVSRGDAEQGFSFFHADDTPYAGQPKSRDVGLSKEASGFLKGWGFKEGEVRAALDAIGPPHAIAGANEKPGGALEAYLRAALAWLTEQRAGLSRARDACAGAHVGVAAWYGARLPSLRGGMYV